MIQLCEKEKSAIVSALRSAGYKDDVFLTNIREEGSSRVAEIFILADEFADSIKSGIISHVKKNLPNVDLEIVSGKEMLDPYVLFVVETGEKLN